MDTIGPALSEVGLWTVIVQFKYFGISFCTHFDDTKRHVINLIENFNTVKNHVDHIQINSR